MPKREIMIRLGLLIKIRQDSQKRIFSRIFMLLMALEVEEVEEERNK
jgi:hypothetical protein